MSSSSSSSSSDTTAAATPAATATATAPTKPSPSFYKRDLPPTCIDYASKEGKALFKLALNEGNMESYFRLASQFTTQSEPAYCGLGTLCMVLNALGVDPQRQWKGPWRWFEDSMLDCCRPLDQVKQSGITLSEFGCLAVCNGLTAKVHRADTVSAAHFLRDIQHTSTQEDKVLCVSYHRGTLGQTGAGHFSPIAGYCAERNMVLLMDVARFKYPPHWVSVDLLWSALLPHDSETGKPRGYVVLHRRDLAGSALLATPLPKLALDASTVATLVRTLRDLPSTFAAHAPKSMDAAIALVLAAIPPALLGMVQERTLADLAANSEQPAACTGEGTYQAPAAAAAAAAASDQGHWRAGALDAFRDTYKRQLSLLLARVQDTHMYTCVSRAQLAGANPALVTLLLLALPLADLAVPTTLADQWMHVWSLDHVPLLVKHEVQGLRAQVDALVKTWCDGCGMTKEEGEREGKCSKRKREAGGEAEGAGKRVRREAGAEGLSFTPSPSPSLEAEADAGGEGEPAGDEVGCCCKGEESQSSAQSTCACCQKQGATD